MTARDVMSIVLADTGTTTVKKTTEQFPMEVVYKYIDVLELDGHDFRKPTALTKPYSAECRRCGKSFRWYKYLPDDGESIVVHSDIGIGEQCINSQLCLHGAAGPDEPQAK